MTRGQSSYRPPQRQERRERPQVDEETEAEQVDAIHQAQTKAHEQGDPLKKDMDALMDEIDSVLERNAKEFVDAYRQKGGQ